MGAPNMTTMEAAMTITGDQHASRAVSPYRIPAMSKKSAKQPEQHMALTVEREGAARRAGARCRAGQGARERARADRL